MVAEPPRFAQNTSARIMGTGLNSNVFASSIVTAARNKITVILSMNIARIEDIIIKVMRILTGLNLTSFAILKHNQRKKPASAIPSTIIIIPVMKMIVSQLIPASTVGIAPSATASEPYQKVGLIMLLKFRVSSILPTSCMQIPNVTSKVSAPQPKVTYCRSILSMTIRTNMVMKIITAVICAIVIMPPSEMCVRHHFNSMKNFKSFA